MPPYSIDEIFESPTPQYRGARYRYGRPNTRSALPWEHSRPRMQLPRLQRRNPMNQQQTREFSASSSSITTSTSQTTAAAATNQTSPLDSSAVMMAQLSYSTSASASVSSRPGSQIEALPPNLTPLQCQAASVPRYERIKNFPPSQASSIVALDAAKRHPVFFTERLHKPPTGVSDGWNGINPVAKGYVFNDGEGRATWGPVEARL